MYTLHFDLLQKVCTFDKYHKLFQLLRVEINTTSLPGKSTCSPLHWEQGESRTRINRDSKENTPAHIRNQPQFSLSHAHTHTMLYFKVKYRHDRTNYSYISRIIFIMRISNKCQNTQWDALVSNGGFCCCCVFQTKMLVSSYRQLKISSLFLYLVQQIYGDIHLAQIFCIPNSVSSFLTHLSRLLEEILYFIIVMYQIVVTF